MTEDDDEILLAGKIKLKGKSAIRSAGSAIWYYLMARAFWMLVAGSLALISAWQLIKWF
jgi:hypothetical protein